MREAEAARSKSKKALNSWQSLALPAILGNPEKRPSICLLLNHSPTSLRTLLLQTKGEANFDRAVTERSKAFFEFVWTSNRIHFLWPPESGNLPLS